MGNKKKIIIDISSDVNDENDDQDDNSDVSINGESSIDDISNNLKNDLTPLLEEFVYISLAVENNSIFSPDSTLLLDELEDFEESSQYALLLELKDFEESSQYILISGPLNSRIYTRLDDISSLSEIFKGCISKKIKRSSRK